ncbi:hypothetical protein EYZ11_010812 [Aspergillus tanneri]|uniref:Uncharacterized protein n=1 Tax=Aspergillus tanneri TaxID=1220188 RepID=A0A4S3J4P6_9EURO|nr:hypothetical protein EYZ11_010812 [Aspergillus tanneri]
MHLLSILVLLSRTTLTHSQLYAARALITSSLEINNPVPCQIIETCDLGFTKCPNFPGYCESGALCAIAVEPAMSPAWDVLAVIRVKNAQVKSSLLGCYDE